MRITILPAKKRGELLLRNRRMYTDYWQLTKKPFENTNDTAFFYYSPDHQEAFSRMMYAVREHKTGFFLTGDYGTGKTFLSRALIKEYAGDKFKFVTITNPRLTSADFIKEINYQLDQNLESSQPLTKVDLLRSVSSALEKNHSNGLHSVIVVDEAQSVEQDSLLEEIRLLLNMQGVDYLLFTLILLGQDILAEKIENMPQLKQRLSIRYHLSPLDKEAAKEYIKYRLKVAGSNKEIFAESGYGEIYNLSGGVPREINNICDLALLTGFIQRKDLIDEDIIIQVGKDLEAGSVK